MDEQAKKDLIDAILHIDLAMNMAEIEVPGSVARIAVCAKREDGSGRVTATFDGRAFLDDVAKVLGFVDVRDLIQRSIE